MLFCCVLHKSYTSYLINYIRRIDIVMPLVPTSLGDIDIHISKDTHTHIQIFALKNFKKLGAH